MKVINLFAGPCTGKSTTAFELIYRMKKLGLKVELIPDLPRDEVFSQSWERLNDHLLQLTKLQHQLNMLKTANIDYVIMESPILMRLAYAKDESTIIKDLIVGLHKEQDSLNVNILRNKNFKYDETGRDQNESEALERTKITDDLVRTHIPNPVTVMSGIRTVSSIFKELNIEDDISITENSLVDKEPIKVLTDIDKKIVLTCKSLYSYSGSRDNGFVVINGSDAEDWENAHGIEFQRGNYFAKFLYDELFHSLKKLDLHPYVRGKEIEQPFTQKTEDNSIVEEASFTLTPFHSKKWGRDDIEDIYLKTVNKTLKKIGFTSPTIQSDNTDDLEGVLLDSKKSKSKHSI